MTKEEEAAKKKAMLRAMLAGVPTKESELIKNFTNATAELVTENGKVTGRKSIELSDSNLKSATELNQAEVMGHPKEVPAKALEALLNGNKSKAMQIVEEEREIPIEMFDTRKRLTENAVTKKNTISTKENILPKSKLIANDNEEYISESVGINKDELKSMIKECVYEILGETFELEAERRQLKENIVIRIGETLFSGQLTPLPKKAKKK